MSGPEVQALAALRGVSVRVAAVDKARAALSRQAAARGVQGGLGAQQWRRMDEGLRAVLVMMVTNRPDPQVAALLPWAQFSDDERLTVGALARAWGRQLDGAGWLR